MKQFFSIILTWALLMLSCGLFYIAVSFPFPSAFINVAAFISAIFALVQGCGLIDKRHGFGAHSGSTSTEKEEKN